MREIEVFEVGHSLSERGGNTRISYAGDEETAKALASQPWGWYGGRGRVHGRKIIRIYESPQEIQDRQDEQAKLREERDKLQAKLEALNSKIKD